MRKIQSILVILLAIIMPAMVSATVASEFVSGASVYADGDLEDEDEDDPPYVEPPFTVYFDIDDADAVRITVNDRPIAHTAGLNTVTVDPGDGYIMVYVNDGYVFTKFYDETQSSDYLQYDNQTMPVTIRKVLAVGSEEGVIVDGDTFTVCTKNVSNVEHFTLTVNVDHASKVNLRVGAGLDMTSSINRVIELHDGENTVEYTEMDKYLHVSGSSWLEPLQSVTFNGRNVVNDGQMNAVYSIQLKGSKTAGGVLDVVAAPDVVEDPYSFTAIIDDVDYVKFVSKMPIDRNVTVVNGENTLTFKNGDYYEFWTRQEAIECTYNGNVVDYDPTYGMYRVSPSNGGTLIMKFVEDVPEGPSFTIEIDDLSLVDSFEDEDENVIELTEGVNKIAIPSEGFCFYLYPVNRTPAYSITIDGEDIAMIKKRFYEIEPRDGSKVVVYFHEPVVVVDPQVTINVDDAYNIVAYTGDYAAASTIIPLDSGVNTFTLDSTVDKINIAPKVGAVIDSLTDGSGNELEPAEGFVYTIDVTDGLTLNVTTHKVSFDESFVMIFEDPDNVLKEAEMMSMAEREISIDPTEFFNEVPYNKDYDQIMFFAFDPVPDAVYVNGEKLDPIEEGVWGFEPNNLDIVRVYFTGGEANVHNVTFDIDPKVADKVEIYRDLYQIVDHLADGSQELYGTYYVIVPTDDEVELFVSYSVEGASETFRAKGESVDVEMSDGMYLIRIEDHMTLSVQSEPNSGVETIATDVDSNAVYNLQGVRLKTDNLKNLPAGIYIVGGRKVMVR